ncbi:MAG: DUF429 domain-containing protein [Acidobacteria bacterium]|nr:DUF429 domain-containing protein [Acidobacteriota bacterium]
MLAASNTVVGVDFGAPRRARDQRRKIIAIAAHAVADRRYRVDAIGVNERLIAKDPPGWSAKELLDELLTRTVRIVAFDFPFSLPDVLLRDEKFAASAGYTHGAFSGWRTFNAFVAERLPLGEPLDFRPFDAWRSRSDRARLWARRATDIVAGGQPPLKDKFQATFQMTLLGNAVLSRLWESHRYRILPFPGGRGTGEVIEVYPGATLRQMGLANYKSRPEEAMRLGIAACTAAGITLDVDPRLRALCCRYSSGGKTPDYDAADAFIALCTAILHAEGTCRMAIDGDALLKGSEGAIWVPRIACRSALVPL